MDFTRNHWRMLQSGTLGGGVYRYFQPGGTAFNWLPFYVIKQGGVPVAIDLVRGGVFDIANYKPSMVGKQTYYVGYTGASDAADGLSKLTSLATMPVALGKADVGCIYVGDTDSSASNHVLFRQRGAFTNPVTVSCSIIGDPSAGNQIKITSGDRPGWSKVAGSTATYKTAKANALEVYDTVFLDANGNYTKYVLAGSYTEPNDLAPGQWYTDNVSVWVRSPDSRNITTGNAGDAIRVMLSVNYGGIITGACTMYLENLVFEGFGINAFRATTGATLYAKNCGFHYARTGNGLQSYGSTTIFQNCRAVSSNLDGFNYHWLNPLYCTSIEIGCTGNDNGWGGGDSNNGSTTHDGNRIVRLSGNYYRNGGPNIADIDPNTMSWLVGCVAGNSIAGIGAQQNDSFQSGITGAYGMWLDECQSIVSVPGAHKYDRVAVGGGIMHCRKFTGGGNDYSVGSTLDDY